MSDNQLPQRCDKVRPATSFDEFDVDYSWMADDSLEHCCHAFLSEGTLGQPLNLGLGTPVPGDANEAQALNIFHDNWTHDEATQLAASRSNTLTEKPFLCSQCPAVYRRLGDLTRHQKEKHSAASSKYLCHIELCPRGIAGEGFGRIHHLVAHLKSKKHGMDAKEAAYMARQHNLPKSKVAGNEGLGVEEAL